MPHRLSPAAELELDEIWLYVARRSGSVEIADRLIESIAQRFLILARQPHLGRRRDHDLSPGLRTFPAGEYVIVYRQAIGPDGDSEVVILNVIHGGRNLVAHHRGR